MHIFIQIWSVLLNLLLMKQM